MNIKWITGLDDAEISTLINEATQEEVQQILHEYTLTLKVRGGLPKLKEALIHELQEIAMFIRITKQK